MDYRGIEQRDFTAPEQYQAQIGKSILPTAEACVVHIPQTQGDDGVGIDPWESMPNLVNMQPGEILQLGEKYHLVHIHGDSHPQPGEQYEAGGIIGTIIDVRPPMDSDVAGASWAIVVRTG